MINKLKLFEVVISDLLTNEQFDGLFKLFDDNSLSIGELIVFYKQNSKILKKSKFWQSRLPCFEISGILKSELKNEFLRVYFSKNDFCNDLLNKYLFGTDFNEVKHSFKLWQAFKHENFQNSLHILSNGNQELKHFYEELIMIIKAQNHINKGSKEIHQFFKQYPIDEVFLGFVLAYHAAKRDLRFKNNKVELTRIEIAIIDELNNIINNASYLKGHTSYNNNIEIQASFLKNEKPHPILEPDRNNEVEERFGLISVLINELLKHNINQRNTELYLTGFAKFETKLLNPAHLLTNEQFDHFRYNDIKSVPEEYFISEFNIELDPSKRDQFLVNYLNGKGASKYLSYYGISSVIEFKKEKIELEKIFTLLKHISYYKGPKRQIFVESEIICTNKPSDLFQKHFGSNESISIFDGIELIEAISQYFNWSKSEVEIILDYLTLDLNEEVSIKNWLYRPFIKIFNKYYWLGAFLSERRWETVLFSRIKKETQGNKVNNDYANSFETKIQKIFQDQCFETLKGYQYRSATGVSGDIDVLAYKQNFLYVIEVKHGVGSNDFSHAAILESSTLEGKATYQLYKAIDFIKEDWNNIKRLLKIPEEVPFSSLEVVPLIVTNYFEADHKKFKNYHKTTLLELDVILNNRKKDLLQNYLLMQKSINTYNQDLIDTKLEIAWDLWEGNDYCHPAQLYKCISQNLVWKELQSTWHFQNAEIKLYY